MTENKESTENPQINIKELYEVILDLSKKAPLDGYRYNNHSHE